MYAIALIVLLVLRLLGIWKPGPLPPRAPSRNDYEAYIQSPHWRAVRGLALKRDGYRCTRCAGRYSLQVHHLTYKHLGHEERHLEDLRTLCRTCHRRAHGR